MGGGMKKFACAHCSHVMRGQQQQRRACDLGIQRFACHLWLAQPELTPTDAPPGSDGKLAVLQHRADAELPLHHLADTADPGEFATGFGRGLRRLLLAANLGRFLDTARG